MRILVIFQGIANIQKKLMDPFFRGVEHPYISNNYKHSYSPNGYLDFF